MDHAGMIYGAYAITMGVLALYAVRLRQRVAQAQRSVERSGEQQSWT